MNSQQPFNIMQYPNLKEHVTKFQASLNADHAKMRELGSQNAQLIQQLNNMNVAMRDVLAARDVLKEKHAASQSREQELESQNAELLQQLKNMNVAMQDLLVERDTLRGQNSAIQEERDFYMQSDKLRAGSVQKLQEQLQKLTKELTDKDLEIQTLQDKLVSSQEEGTRKSMKLLEQHAKELNDKNLAIGDLETHLVAAEQRTDDKLKVLEEQHAKQIKNKDLEIQTLQDKQATGQEQYTKELNDKDLVIQEMEGRLPAAELQTVDKVMELRNENNRLLQGIQKLQQEKDRAEQRLQGVAKMQEALHQSRQESRSHKVVSEPTTQHHTNLHTELGKLYMELQDAKKPQEALMAQLAAKDKEIEYLTEQHKAKLAAKDSEIQNLKEMIQGGEQMNAAMVDGQSE